MSGGVRQAGDFVVKSCHPARDAEVLVRRTRLLRSQGLQTPPVILSRSGRSLRFDRIDGETAQACLLKVDLNAGLARVLTPVVKRSLQPVAALHACNAVWAARYQPFRLIDPRLEVMAQSDAVPNEHRALATVIRAALARMVPPVPERNCLLHGDLHPGQIILEEAPATGAWLIDLDDMGCGDPEADLGNLIAHMLTSGVPGLSADRACMDIVMHLVGNLYECRAGLQAEPGLVRVYALAALLRRALKLMLERKDHAAGSRIMGFVAAECGVTQAAAQG